MRFLVCIAAVICVMASSVRGATRAEALFADVSEEGGWVPLAVTVDVPAPGGIVWVRDARGGVEFGRPVDPGENRRVVVSVPLLSPSKLRTATGLEWQVRVRVGSLSEDAGTHATGGEVITVEKPPAERSAPLMHIAVPASAQGTGNLSEILTATGEAGLSSATIPDEELLAAPPLSLAGVDAVIVTPRLAGSMYVERAVSLMAVGIRLVYPGEIPPAGSLADLKWTQREKVWVAPLEATAMPLAKYMTAPAVAEASLANLPVTPPTPSGALKAVAWALTPAVVVLLLFVRAITARAGVIVAILAVCLPVGAGLTVAALASTSGPEDRELSWTSRAAPGNLSVTETLTIRNSLFPSQLDLSSNEAVPTLPMAASPEGWFALAEGEGDRLLLDSRALPTRRVARFWGKQEPRRPRAFLSRSATAAWPVPADPDDAAWKADLSRHQIDLAAGVRVENGHIQMGGERVTLRGWLSDQPPAVRAWYELRFWGARTYQVQPEGGLRVVDFGEGR